MKIYKNIKITVDRTDFPIIAVGANSTMFGVALIGITIIISWK